MFAPRRATRHRPRPSHGPHSPTVSLTTGLGTLDAAVFDAVARTSNPLLDAAMPRLTRAADKSVLWIGIGGLMVASERPAAQRAAVRGLMSIAVTSLVTNQLAKRLRPRQRPDLTRVPLSRRARRRPTSNSWPSGHSASAAAFAVAVSTENLPAGVALGALAGLVGFSRVATGAHYPGDVLAGLGIGTAIAAAGARLVPPIREHSIAIPDPTWLDVNPSETGAGLTVVMNPGSGDGDTGHIIEEIQRRLPDAQVIELSPEDDVEEVFREAAQGSRLLGVSGGDGTVATAAAAALAADIPLAVFPGGTFNHFAKDIGCARVHDTIEAIRAGTVTMSDVVMLNGDTVILNTASVGAYPHFVRTRERLESTIGRRGGAGALALLRTYRRDPRTRIRFGDKTSETSLFLIGNGLYQPSGFAPSRRLRVDDGLLDVRILDSGPRWSTARLIGSLLTGRLGRSKLYHEMAVPEFEFSCLDGPTVLAHDGEIGPALENLRFTVGYRALKVLAPRD